MRTVRTLAQLSQLQPAKEAPKPDVSEALADQLKANEAILREILVAIKSIIESANKTSMKE